MKRLVFMRKKTYEIIRKGDTLAIKCLICNMTSYHPVDVEKKYCANCKIFHIDILSTSP